MTQMGIQQPHDPILGKEKTGIDRQVGRRAQVTLNIHTPLLRIEMKQRERALAAELLDLVDVLVPSIVSGAGHSFGVVVGKVASKRLENCSAREILRRNELESSELPLLLPLHDLEVFRVRNGDGLVAPRSNCRPPGLEGRFHGDPLRGGGFCLGFFRVSATWGTPECGIPLRGSLRVD